MQQPYISIVIPAHNRPARLQECLESLSLLRYPATSFEVIVVDDGSSQPLDQAVEPFKSLLKLRLVRQKQSGPAAARNTGLRWAEGALVAFTDDDCRPRPEWLSRLAAGHAENPDAALSGPVRNAARSIFSETSQMLIDFLIEYYDPVTTGRGFFTSNNLAFPAEMLRALNGFNTSFPLAAAEDRELCDRWQRRGGRMVFLPGAIVDHRHHMGLIRFVRQQFNYGRGAFLFHDNRAKTDGRPMSLEGLAFYLRMHAYPFGKQPLPRAIAAAVLLTVSQAVIAYGFFHERLQQARRQSSMPSHPGGRFR